ncbi:MAG: crotonase/enoyl-CoA hydratase family protein [Microbacterium gubbeenense]
MTDETEPVLLVEERGRVLVLTLNRPRARNAISLELATALGEALEALDRRDDLSVAVLTGAGGFFCAGMDLKGFARGEIPIIEGKGFAGLVERPPCKPLIAAVEGYALGGGFEIALACDLIIADDTANFGLPETKRGLTAGAGGLLRLAQRIPYHRAMELVLTGRMLPAEEAHGYGLLTTVAAAGGALDAAQQVIAARDQLLGEPGLAARGEVRAPVADRESDPQIERRQGRRHRLRGEARARLDELVGPNANEGRTD